MRVVFGGLLVVLAGCGGHTESSTGSSDSLPAPSRDREPGLYFAPAGGPEHVADDLGAPTAIAVTEDSVVFTTKSSTISGERVAAGALYVANKRVGPALVLAIDRQGASFDALATDGTTAFFATSDARVLALPLSGGMPKVVASLAAPASTLAVFGEYMYFATTAGALGRVSKKGGAIEPLATITGAIRGLQADGTAVYVATGAAEETPAGIVRVPLDGSDVRVLTSRGEPCAMIRDERSLFWTSLPPSATDTTDTTTTAAKGEVLRLSLDGGAVATVASGAFTACAIAADKESLYFATTLPNALSVKAGGTGSGASTGLGLMRAPIGGGDPVAIVQASRVLAQPGAVAVDASHVYWLTETAVLRLRK